MEVAVSSAGAGGKIVCDSKSCRRNFFGFLTSGLQWMTMELMGK